MQTLVIHPTDASTDFLSLIYEHINCTLIRGNCTKNELFEMVNEHDRIIMLGHGSPGGLFAVGQFINEGRLSYIIDESFVKLLRRKENNVYIWCYANRFVEKYGLKGFYTGMFISENAEALMYGIDPQEEEVNRSNKLFSSIAGEIIETKAKNIYSHVKSKYKLPGSTVRDFNYERLYWR
jgi:hypothetical protein